MNYDRISAGRGIEGMRALTGMPVFSFSHSKGEAFLKPIHQRWAAKNYPMTNGCCTQNTPQSYGLASGHAYSLLDVIDVEGGVTLAKVRNPWSSEGYRGPYSDSDTTRWTETLKAQVGFNAADDGIFYMIYSEYLQTFYSTGVAVYE